MDFSPEGGSKIIAENEEVVHMYLAFLVKFHVGFAVFSVPFVSFFIMPCQQAVKFVTAEDRMACCQKWFVALCH